MSPPISVESLVERVSREEGYCKGKVGGLLGWKPLGVLQPAPLAALPAFSAGIPRAASSFPKSSQARSPARVSPV